MDTIHLLVSPEALRVKADEVGASIAEVKGIVEEISTTVSRTNGFWLGKAATAHRNKYDKVKASANETIARFSGHVTKLEEMAGIYDASERALAQSAAALPTEVIQ